MTQPTELALFPSLKEVRNEDRQLHFPRTFRVTVVLPLLSGWYSYDGAVAVGRLGHHVNAGFS